MRMTAAFAEAFDRGAKISRNTWSKKITIHAEKAMSKTILIYTLTGNAFIISSDDWRATDWYVVE